MEDVQAMAETFEERTRHFSTWTKTLGQTGNNLYRFLAEQDVPTAYVAVRQRFSQMNSSLFQSTLDALLYHGLIHCHGRGRSREYQIAGRMYRDWFLAVGKPGVVEQPEPSQQTPADATIIVQGDYVAGDKPTGDEDGARHQHGQTEYYNEESLLPTHPRTYRSLSNSEPRIRYRISSSILRLNPIKSATRPMRHT